MRHEAKWVWGGAVLAALAFAGVVLGAPPVTVSVVALVVWIPVAARRVGPALGAGAVATGWMLALLVSTVVSHVGVPASLVAAVLLTAATLGAPFVVRRHPVSERDGRRIAPLAVAAIAPALWAVAVVWGAVAPQGAGLSWAMHRDSTMNVWGLRRMLEAGGIDSFTVGANIQPLQDALGLALTPWTAGISASPEDVTAAVIGYASLWAVVIALASGLGALIVATTTVRRDSWRWLTAAVSVALGLALTSSVVTGVLIDLGQVNVHVVLTLVSASVLAAAGARRAPYLAVGTLLTAAALLLACWGPFAAVPGLLVCVVGVQWRRTLWTALTRGVGAGSLPLVVGTVSAAVCLVVWGIPLLETTIPTAVAPPVDGSTLQQVTFSREGHWESYTNPAWPPLGAVLLGMLIVAAVLRGRRSLTSAWMAGVTLLSVAAAIVAASRAPLDALPYFPAKALWVACVAALPLVAAVFVTWADAASATVRCVGYAAVAVVVATLILAPTPAGVDRWGHAAIDVTTGHHVGTREEVASRVLDWSSDEAFVLPWRLDPPHDTTVALMASAFSPSIPRLEFDRTRYVLRYYRNDFASEVACELAAADVRPLRLVTADPSLEQELNALCPDAGIAVELRP